MPKNATLRRERTSVDPGACYADTRRSTSALSALDYMPRHYIKTFVHTAGVRDRCLAIARGPPNER